MKEELNEVQQIVDTLVSDICKMKVQLGVPKVPIVEPKQELDNKEVQIVVHSSAFSTSVCRVSRCSNWCHHCCNVEVKVVVATFVLVSLMYANQCETILCWCLQCLSKFVLVPFVPFHNVLTAF